MIGHKTLVANDGAVIIFRRHIAVLFLLEARRPGVKSQRRAVMGGGLASPNAPAPVVVLVDDEGATTAGGIHEAGRQTHVGQIALSYRTAPFVRPLAVPDVVLAPGPRFAGQQTAFVVGPEVVFVVPLGQQQTRPPQIATTAQRRRQHAVGVPQVDSTEVFSLVQRGGLSQHEFQACSQIFGAIGMG